MPKSSLAGLSANGNRNATISNNPLDQYRNSDNLPFLRQLCIFYKLPQMTENREDAQYSAPYPPRKNGLC